MAPRPPAPGIIKIELMHAMAGQPAVNVLHALWAGPEPTEGSLSDAAFAVRESWETRLVPALASAYQFRGARLTDLTSDSGAQSEHDALLEGEDVRPLTDAARAMCITMRTSLRTRSGRGRLFMPGLVDAKCANARHWLDDAVQDTVVRMEQFRAEIDQPVLGPIGLTLGVLSYFSGVDPVTGAPILRGQPLFTPMTRWTADTRLDHQRRRVGKS